MIRYKLHTKQVHNDEYGTYKAYGVTASCRGKVICTIEDISLDKRKIEELVRVCNREHLSPSHLAETIENFLYDFDV